MAKKNSKKNQSQINKANIFSQINWSESYVSLFLGAAVVIIAAVLAFSFIRTRNISRIYQTDSAFTSQEETAKTNKTPKTYVVKEGDGLWGISEKVYGSGYNWTDIATANNLMENPGTIFTGTKLSIPDVKVKVAAAVAQSEPVVQGVDTAAVVNNSIKAGSYAVISGDDLWEIAVRAYGDGYRWVDIAKANNLANPDLIFSGNVLILPR